LYSPVSGTNRPSAWWPGASFDGRRRFEQSLIEIQLNHFDRSTRAIYDRDDCMPERVALMQFWADKIDDMRETAKATRFKAAA